MMNAIRKTSLILITLAGLALALPNAAFAEPKNGKGPKHSRGQNAETTIDSTIDEATDTLADAAIDATGIVFTNEEKRIIREVLGTAADHATGRDRTRERDQDGWRKWWPFGKDEEEQHAKSKGKGKSKQMPPGLAKRDELPPGLQMQLEKNGRLPPGLEKRDLPADLKRRLPKPHKGTERAIVGDDVVLIETATGIVLDILSDVVK